MAWHFGTALALRSLVRERRKAPNHSIAVGIWAPSEPACLTRKTYDRTAEQDAQRRPSRAAKLTEIVCGPNTMVGQYELLQHSGCSLWRSIMRKIVLSAGAALIVLGSVGSADAQVRYRPGYYGGGWGPAPYAYRRPGWRGGAVAAGLVGGLVLGGLAAAAAAPAYSYPYC
jgi:hypothetical protein